MSSKGIPLEEALKAGAKVPGLGRKDQLIVDQLACRLVGVLADAPTQETRRKALEKARRMLGVR